MKESWVIDQSKRRKTSDPSQYSDWESIGDIAGVRPELVAWLERRAGNNNTQSWAKKWRKHLMAQQGSLYESHGAWYVRYRTQETQADGTVVMVQRAERLVSRRDIPKNLRSYRSRTIL